MRYDDALSFLWKIMQASQDAEREFVKDCKPGTRRKRYALRDMKDQAEELVSIAFGRSKADVQKDVLFRKGWK